MLASAPAVSKPRLRVVQRWTEKGEERRQVDKQQRVKAWWRVNGAGNVVIVG